MQKTRTDTINAIKFLDIPITKLARMADLEPSRVSEYVRGKSMPTDKTEKIETAVRDIVKVWSVLPVRVDLSDMEGFKRAILIADDILHQEEMQSIAAATANYVKAAEAGLSQVLSFK
jgi:hypothetical protein